MNEPSSMAQVPFRCFRFLNRCLSSFCVGCQFQAITWSTASDTSITYRYFLIRHNDKRLFSCLFMGQCLLLLNITIGRSFHDGRQKIFLLRIGWRSLPVGDMNISAEQWSNKIHFADSDPRIFCSKSMKRNFRDCWSNSTLEVFQVSPSLIRTRKELEGKHTLYLINTQPIYSSKVVRAKQPPNRSLSTSDRRKRFE